MISAEKFEWMAIWCAKNEVQLKLQAECGFGRECVGIIKDGKFPDYYWHSDDYKRIDDNGKVWTPKDAYHKHPCVAVLGRGEEAENQLYEWLQWFDKNNFKIETGKVERKEPLHFIELIMGRDRYVRMVKQK